MKLKDPNESVEHFDNYECFGQNPVVKKIAHVRVIAYLFPLLQVHCPSYDQVSYWLCVLFYNQNLTNCVKDILWRTDWGNQLCNCPALSQQSFLAFGWMKNENIAVIKVSIEMAQGIFLKIKDTTCNASLNPDMRMCIEQCYSFCYRASNCGY